MDKTSANLLKVNSDTFIRAYVFAKSTAHDCNPPQCGGQEKVATFVRSIKVEHITVRGVEKVVSSGDDVTLVYAIDDLVGELIDHRHIVVSVSTSDDLEYVLSKDIAGTLKMLNSAIDNFVNEATAYKPCWRPRPYPCSLKDPDARMGRICRAFDNYHIRKTPEVDTYIVHGGLEEWLRLYGQNVT